MKYLIISYFKKNYDIVRIESRIIYVMLAESAERMSFYGLTSIVILYMVSYLSFSQSEAVVTFSLLRSCGYLAQIFAVYLSSRFLNNYKIIFYSLVMTAFGHILLSLEIFPFKYNLIISIFVIFTMTGFMKPVNIPFLIKQCDENKKLESAVVAWNYWIFNFSVMFVVLACPYLYKTYGPKLGFILPAIFAILAAYFIFLGRKNFIISQKKENENNFVLFKIIKYYFLNRKNHNCLNNIEKLYGNDNLEDFKKMKILFLVWLGALFFFIAYENLYHAMILHSEKLEPFLFGFNVIQSQIQIVISIMPIVGLPIARGFILPLFFKKDIKNSFLLNNVKRMKFGVIFTIIGYFATIIIEILISKGMKINLTWDLIPWGLIGFSEVITYLYLLEFFSSYLSEKNRVLSSVIFTFSILLSSLIISFISKMLGKIDAIYFCFSLISGIISFLFFKFTIRFLKKNL